MAETVLDDCADYRVLDDVCCCQNCRHSYTRMGLSLYCFNKAVWAQEHGVQALGLCRGFLWKQPKEEA